MGTKLYKVNIAFPGVLDYGSNGLIFRDQETLVADCKSLEGKPFTMMHPKKETDTETLKIGKVKSVTINDSGFSGVVAVDDPLTQRVIDTKTAIEVSPCYQAQINKAETVIDGKTVSGKQTKIWGFKHLALVEAGRGGQACAIVTDSENTDEYTAEFNDSLAATFELIPPKVMANVIKDSVGGNEPEPNPDRQPDPDPDPTPDFTPVRNFLCTILDGLSDTERSATSLEDFARSYITRTVDAEIVMDGLSTQQMLTAYTIDKHYKNLAKIDADAKNEQAVKDSAKEKLELKEAKESKPPTLSNNKVEKPANNFPQFFN